MSGNPAYEQVTLKSIVVQENSAYSIVHTPVEDSSQHNDVPLCMYANSAYGQRVTQHNSTYYSETAHTESVVVAQYENIAIRDGKRRHDKLCEYYLSLCVSVVDKCLSIAAATSSSQQDVVPVSANLAYGGIVLQENSVYSTTSVAEYENIDRKTMPCESLILSVCG